MTAEVILPFLAAIVGGALRVGVPFLFVSLGECLTEKAGRINLGLEGVLVLSAVAVLVHAWLPAAEASAAKDLHGHAEELVVHEACVDGEEAHQEDAVPVGRQGSTCCGVRSSSG